MRSSDFDVSTHVADPQDREVEFRRLCRLEDIDPERFRAAWMAGEVDPDAGYNPDSPYYGKDIATLAMLLPAAHLQPARRA
jgi:hypothetical protein